MNSPHHRPPAEPASGRRLLIGLGNDFRHDDGVGPVIARRARALLGQTVEVVTLEGDAADLVNLWHPTDLTVVVDAVRTGSPRPGRIHVWRIDPSGGSPVAGREDDGGAHGMGLGCALALSRQLGRLPTRLVLFAIEGGDFSPGPGLSAPVEAAVEPCLTRLLAEFTRSQPETAAAPASGPDARNGRTALTEGIRRGSGSRADAPEG